MKKIIPMLLLTALCICSQIHAQLQRLIEQGLIHNTDLNVARLRIDQAEATIKAARLANLPSLAFSPNAGISSFDGEKATKTYAFRCKQVGKSICSAD